jgi:hypothetical protein
VGSPLGLYSSEVAVGMDPCLCVAAFPRFYPGLVRALGLLEGGLAGDASAQGARSRVSRRGEEYAWTREHVPGDPDKLIDWKATARRARLCVKEFHEEQGGGAMVFFDGRAPGAVSADEMARDLLSVCVGLAEEGREACFVSEGAGGRGAEGGGDGAGEGSTGRASVVDRAGPGEMLRIAVAGALGMAASAGGGGAGGGEGGAFALMPPKVRSAVMEILRKGYGGAAAMPVPVNVEGGAYAEAIRRVRDAPASLAYVGCPIYEPERALALVDAAACGAGGGSTGGGGRAAALMPERPWLDAGTLEGAYEMRESYLRIAGKVREAAARGAGGAHAHDHYVYAKGAAGAGAAGATTVAQGVA